MNREDFLVLNTGTIYFDNGATTLTPKQVVEAMDRYYYEHTSNIHRGDYKAAMITNELYDSTREVVKDFVNAPNALVIYTKGATEAINLVVFGYMKNNLKKGDEVLLNKAEHASNILPWIKLSEEIGIVIKYVPLDSNYEVTYDNVKNSITDKTKVISIAGISNVVGDVRDLKRIGALCKEKGILLNVDGAQSVPHMKTDFLGCNMDFLSFSAHKMVGPTGVGCLVVKKELIDKMEPLIYGGGMNQVFEADNTYELKTGVSKFEGGTPPIAEVIGLREAIKYLEDIGMDNIHKYEMELKEYMISELSKIDNIKLYNKTSTSGILSFNIKDVFAQDTAIYLNHYNICVRAGNHCTKLLKDELNIKNTVRVSLYFYNTKEEIDKLIEVLKQSYDIFKVVI